MHFLYIMFSLSLIKKDVKYVIVTSSTCHVLHEKIIYMYDKCMVFKRNI